MAWSLPDKGEGANDVQSILFQEYLDVLIAGLLGVDCVLSGCAVTAQGAPDMTCAVAKGAVLTNGALFPVLAGNVTITTADATNPRLDLVVANNAGVKAVRAGTPGANPKPPARSSNDVVLAVVYIPAADTTISTNQIQDLRILRGGIASGGGAPMVVKKTTTPVTFTNNGTIQTYFTITLPSGLFLTGQMLRVTLGGTYLLNTTSAAWTLTVAYGGTNMLVKSWTPVLAAGARAWHMEFILRSRGNALEELTGLFAVTAAVVAGGTGTGDFAATDLVSPMRGTAAVDSDAADRTLTVQFTMNVGATHTITMEYGLAELI